MKKFRVILIGIARVWTATAAVVFPHRSGCHSWHSCPSDTAKYVCGDLGHCSECPDNAYCEEGQTRRNWGLSFMLTLGQLENALRSFPREALRWGI